MDDLSTVMDGLCSAILQRSLPQLKNEEKLEYLLESCEDSELFTIGIEDKEVWKVAVTVITRGHVFGGARVRYDVTLAFNRDWLMLRLRNDSSHRGLYLGVLAR
jgi:hypothetical protein